MYRRVCLSTETFLTTRHLSHGTRRCGRSLNTELCSRHFGSSIREWHAHSVPILGLSPQYLPVARAAKTALYLPGSRDFSARDLVHSFFFFIFLFPFRRAQCLFPHMALSVVRAVTSSIRDHDEQEIRNISCNSLSSLSRTDEADRISLSRIVSDSNIFYPTLSLFPTKSIFLPGM